MIDWGVPDWTGEENYPAPDGQGEICVWAWEFLRRWNEYRDFWLKKIQPFIDMGGRISRDTAGNCWPHLEELRTRFGVEVPSPPQCSTPPHFIANAIRWVQNYGRESQEIWLNEHEVAFIFDLSRPLKSQFEMARDAAECEKERRRQAGEPKLSRARSRAEQYVTYLRILDAQESGAKPKDIAARLFHDLSDEYPARIRQKRLVDYRQAAEKLRDGGYRSLLVA